MDYTQGNPTLIASAMAGSLAFYGMAGRGATAPGAVVLRKLDDGRAAEYVVHFFNSQDGGYYFGDYTATLVQAYEAFAEKVRRFDPTGELNAHIDNGRAADREGSQTTRDYGFSIRVFPCPDSAYPDSKWGWELVEDEPDIFPEHGFAKTGEEALAAALREFEDPA